MKIVWMSALVLILSACNAHALRGMLEPEAAPAAQFSRLQFNCTAGGLFIFEDFPDLEVSELSVDASLNAPEKRIQGKQNSAAQPQDCLSSLK